MTSLKDIYKKLLTKENFFFGIYISLIFFLDQFSKHFVVNNFSEQKYYINDFLNIDLIWNIGIGFGLLSFNDPIFYELITLLIGSIIVILFYIFLNSKGFEKLIFSTIVGGALGNFYDRLLIKAVPDFIDLHYNNFHWFTFNIADIFVTIGVIFLLIKNFYEPNSNAKNN